MCPLHVLYKTHMEHQSFCFSLVWEERVNNYNMKESSPLLINLNGSHRYMQAKVDCLNCTVNNLKVWGTFSHKYKTLPLEQCPQNLFTPIVTVVTQITYKIISLIYGLITRPLNITFLHYALSSPHLMGFESSLINFTCPHFCPQLFIGPYYENLNLLFDYWLLPPEACGFWCIIEQSWSHKWLLHARIKG